MLTLVVPVYNMVQYLPRCMEVLLRQTCSTFEILLIDDGSTDGSGAMCDSYAAEHPGRVRVIHKPNGGLSSARNAGIEAAKGAFIVFPDPDDWVEPEYVDKFLELQQHYDADLVCTGYYIDTDNSSIPAKQDNPPFILSGQEAQRGLILPPEMGGFSWNKLYRLDLIRKHGLWFQDDVGITEDLDFAYRYLAFCQTVCFAPVARTYHYYQREGAATRSCFSKRKLDSLRTYEKIIADCQKTMQDLAQAAKDEICTTAVNLLWMYQNSGVEDPASKRLLLRQIREHLLAYLRGKRYGSGRKVQAVLAAFCPGLYARLKNAVQHK